MRRPGYREAVRWIAANDDTEWLDTGPQAISVTGALVADLFGVDNERLTKDLRRALTKRGDRGGAE